MGVGEEGGGNHHNQGKHTIPEMRSPLIRTLAILDIENNTPEMRSPIIITTYSLPISEKFYDLKRWFHYTTMLCNATAQDKQLKQLNACVSDLY